MHAISNPTRPTIEQIWSWLEAVTDPEIPAVSVVDLGIVRDIEWSAAGDDSCVVRITPTYSACPAAAVIQQSIGDELKRHGLHARLEVRLSPPWTTDSISARGREQLRLFGIAPPAGRAAQESGNGLPILEARAPQQPACPRCGSRRTAIVSQFGSTLCKALYRCEECREPFDYFKPH